LLTGSVGALTCVEFSPDGTLVAAGAADRTVHVWDTRQGMLVATLVGLDAGGWAILLPDGSYRLAGSPGRSFWWVVRSSTFGHGELDGIDPAVRRLDEQQAAPSLA
nr:hypothetical protein [Micromonospora sp. DSM 115978]